MFRFTYTVNFRYLKVEGTLKHSEISVLRHIRFAELRKIQKEQQNFTNKNYVIWLLKLKIYTENTVEKGRNSPLIQIILLPDVRFLKEEPDFLFEIMGYSR